MPRLLPSVRFAVMAAVATATLAFPTLAQMHGGMGGNQGGNHPGGTMGRRMGGTMLVSGGSPYHADGSLLTLAEASEVAMRFLAASDAPSAVVDEVTEWDYNFSVVVREASPSEYEAFRLLVDKWTGVVMQEPGPDMMWNAKYRMRGSGSDAHMGMHGTSGPSGEMTVTADAAAAAANRFLAERFGAARNLAVSGSASKYYGYYAFDVVDTATDRCVGVVSVHGGTSQVWYHTWYGDFVRTTAAP